MKLIFAFKNISANTFLKFVDEKENIRDFILTMFDKYPYPDNYFLKRVDYYKDTLPNFENEILQVINTTDQATIDFYFYELVDICNYIKQRIDEKDIESYVKKWNEESLKDFEKQTEQETDEYLKNGNRKLKHLEEYETHEKLDLMRLISGAKPKTIRKTNYNFYCIEKQPDLINVKYIHDYHVYVSALSNYFFDIAFRYIIPYRQGEIKSNHKNLINIKPVVFVEGEHDITYIKRAAEILSHQKLLEKVEIRQRGGFKNLDKLWDIFKADNWETIPQKKLLLYDCDVNRGNDEIGSMYKRTINYIPKNIISKGIENLFPTSMLKKAIKEKPAFVDVIRVKRVIRGKTYLEIIYTVNENEKKNLCNWICDNATAKDFRHFNQIFSLISEIV